MTGRLHVGTSGFAYPGWAPRFYPAGLRGDGLLAHYGSRLDACELNNTFYRQPSPERITSWLAAVPADFRFTVKAQRGGAYRSLRVDPGASVPWLTGPYRLFGERLGSVLFRVAAELERDDRALTKLLAEWPSDVPLTIEFQHPSWHVDETFEALAAAGAALCATDLPEDAEAPAIRRTASFLYLRLRRHDYSPLELTTWAGRIEPFLAAGDDVFVFFRHDEVGRGAELALAIRAEVERLHG
ncbi:MAG: DUF72 domain-containing protein [Chloroflexi bacterium]|nr:DUF72 domain-containing protein [Chloroflexota bacterium]